MGIMGITSEQIHNVLRTYSRQIDLRNRLRDRGPCPDTSQGDRVSISLKAQTTAIPPDIVERLARDIDGENNGARQRLQSLARLHNCQLKFGKTEDTIKVSFIDEKTGQVTKELELALPHGNEGAALGTGKELLIREITRGGGKE